MADDSSMPFDHDDGHLTSKNDDADARDTAETTGETPPNSEAEATPEDPQEGAVPPGYDWPTHGGYLGCLLGLMASCLIGGFLGSTLFPALSYSYAVPKVVAAVLTVVVFLGVTVGVGRLGWVLGKRFYREYPQTRRENADQAIPHESLQSESAPATGEKDSSDDSQPQSSDSSAVDMPIDTH